MFFKRSQPGASEGVPIAAKGEKGEKIEMSATAAARPQALQASELRQRFTAQHPAFASLNEKIHTLRAERAAINARMQGMPEVEADSSRLQRDLRTRCWPLKYSFTRRKGNASMA